MAQYTSRQNTIEKLHRLWYPRAMRQLSLIWLTFTVTFTTGAFVLSIWKVTSEGVRYLAAVFPAN